MSTTCTELYIYGNLYIFLLLSYCYIFLYVVVGMDGTVL